MSDTAGCPSGLAPSEEAEARLDPRAFVRQSANMRQLDLAVFGARCAGCISKIEKGVGGLSGISATRLNLSTGRLHVEWVGDLDPRLITEKIVSLGYRAAPFEPEAAEKDKDEYGRLLLKCLAVSGFAIANIMLLSVSVWASGEDGMGNATRDFLHLISALIAIPAAAYAGRPFFSSAWAALKMGHANMDVPISLAVILAVGVSVFEALSGGTEAYFDAALMLLFFLLIGRWLDHQLRRKAHAAAQDLLALQAVTTTRLLSNGTAEAVAAKDIAVGDRLNIAPGDRFPVNVRIISGVSDVDTSLLTGETEPVTMGLGNGLSKNVDAGVVNLTQSLTVEALATAENSMIADLVRMVEAGQQAKSHYVRLADKAAKAYVPIVHSLALLTLLGWMFLAHMGVRDSLMAAISVLIITCPCAMGLATPAVQVVATGALFRRGILVRTGDALERLSKATHFVFDKTGTLTTGKMAWLNAQDIDAATLAAVGALARGSRHPISRAIVAQLGGGALAEDIKEVPGQGITGTFDGHILRLGKADFMGAATLKAGASQGAGGPSAWFQIDDQPPMALRFEDAVRPGAQELLDDLNARGIKVTMLSGDHSAAVERLATELGIEDWHAEQSPAQKATFLQALEARGAKVAMVGDGLNDTPALAHASVSLSPGSAAEAAQSAADFVFQGNDLKSVKMTYDMARRSQNHIVQNFAFAALYNIVAAPVAMAGLVTPLIAALAMSGSSMVVTLNAMRLRIKGDDKI